MMKPRRSYRTVIALILCLTMILSSISISAATQPGSSDMGDGTYRNPVIWADVPDMDIIRVGDTYWMSSTSMHMSPGVPIMKSYDLVNWETVSYCYNVLGDADILKLQTGQNSYSQGSWASTLRYRDGTFYLIVPARVEGSTWRAQVFTTTDPETVPWTRHELPSRYHDCGLILDDDGRNYLVFGGGEIVELNADLTAAIPGTQRRLVNSLFAPHPVSGDMPSSGTLAEGSHMRKIGGYYYLISITGGGYPSGQEGSGWLRTVSAHRAPSLTTPPEEWESKVLGMESVNGSGVAQGDIVYTGNGDPNVDRDNWYGLFFRDSDAGGRMPWLMPVTWVDDWPMLGEGGSYAPYPRTENIPITMSGGNEKKSVVTSDEFYNNAPRPLYYDTPVTPTPTAAQSLSIDGFAADTAQLDDPAITPFDLENLALNKPARSSRVENDSPNRQPAAAFDGIIDVQNGDNRWGNPGGTSNNWIEVDLGEECDLDSINIYWFNSSDPPRVHYYNIWVKTEEIVDFTANDVIGSGKTASQFESEGYTLAVDKTGNTVGVETTDSLVGTKARYVAIHVTGQSAGTAASIREIEIFGSIGAPGAPSDVVATRGDGEVTLTWTTPVQGGSPITKMQVSLDDGAWIDLPSDAVSYTFTELENGIWHDFNVRAVNDIDTGRATTVRQTAWPAGGGNRNIVINGDFEDPDISMWTFNDTAVNTRVEDPLNPGNYVMRSSGRTTTGSGPAQLQTSLLTPMIKGETYTVSAKVYYGEHVSPETSAAHSNRQFYMNIRGSGSYSSEYNPIRNMAGVNASRNGWRTMTGSYTVPADLEEPYVNIFVETAWASDPTPVDNLFDFLVDDISIIGPPVGDPPIDPMLPGVPSGVQATPGNAKATLNWAPPANIGGSAIIGYKVSIDGENWISLSETSRAYTFTDLNNGTRYTLRVRAINNAGDGAIATADVAPTVETGALYGYNGSNLNLAWQWNHNPDNRYWSLTERAGWLRLRTGYISPHILQAPNTLTQRTFGPNSSAYTYIDVSNMKNGDEAGITLLTAKYGSIGVKMEDGSKTIVTTLANGWSSGTHGQAGNAGVVDGTPVPLTGDGVYLKAEANLVPNPSSNPYGSNARGRFYYSLDGITWTQLGDALQMTYSTSNHFMGYRFGLYNFAKTETGGYVDFDFYRISDILTADEEPTILGASLSAEANVVGSAGSPANVQLLLDPLPTGSYSKITASFEIPKYLTVSDVTFSSSVTGKTAWTVKGNQLEFSTTSVEGNPAGFSPVSRSRFATIHFTLDRDLSGDLKISVAPDTVTVQGANVVYNLAGVEANINYVGLGFEEDTSKFTSANPYLPLWEHLPDNEPRVFEDPDNPGKYRAYIIGSHDVRRTSYCGPDIRMWSAPIDDLSNWRDDGPIFTYRVNDTSNFDVMYAPDMVEVRRFSPEVIARGRTPEDERTIVEYYLYPHSTSDNGMVCKSDRPDGPFVPINLGSNGRSLSGSIVGFDPSAWVDYIDDPADPDYNIGFRAYVYYGFQRSYADELDQDTMWSRRPGTSRIDYFMPSSSSYGVLRDPPGTEYPCLAPGEDPRDFNFFEASSMRKIGNKYIVVFSGYSGPDYGMSSTNSALRWAYGDTPLGPFKSGGVLVDSRGPVLNQNGTGMVGGQWGHNTHGSLWEINGQWYTTYHRPPRGNGNARQAVVAPIKVTWTSPSVLEGGTVMITGYDQFAEGNVWSAKTNDGVEYKGAEVTSEGFNLYGLPPYRYYSAGIVSDHQGTATLQDSYDIWDSHMPIENAQNGYRAGFKYFGFGGLPAGDPDKGLRPFEGTKPGNNTKFNVWLTPKTSNAFSVNVWLDGPWDNSTWKGTQIGTIDVPAGSEQVPTQFTIDVSSFVDNLEGKHAIYLVMSGGSGALCDLLGLGFSSDNNEIERPVSPEVSISVGGTAQTIPALPIASTNSNGIYDYFRYQVSNSRPDGDTTITASASDPSVKVMVTQAPTSGPGLVRFFYEGVMKQYRLFANFVNVATADADEENVAAILEADDAIGSEIEVDASGSETPAQLIAIAQPIVNGISSIYGVSSEITYDNDNKWFVLNLSKGETAMAVPQFEILTGHLQPTTTGMKDSGMDNVTLTDSFLVNATQKNIDYLLSLDAERLLYHYYNTAGLPTPAGKSSYGGWEGGNNPGAWNFRGFTLGRYMAGLSQLYIGLPDGETKDAILAKIKQCINGLKECQDAYAASNPDSAGFISAFPEARLAEMEVAGGYNASSPNPVVPYWITDSLLTGVVDIAKYVTDDPIGDIALDVASKFGDYMWTNRTSTWTTTIKNRVLAIEYGGMNIALYSLYELTGDVNHRRAAEAFDEFTFFDQLAAGQDVLPGKHANTQIPKIVGAMKRYVTITQNEEYYNSLTEQEKEELETRYLKTATNFWDIVVNDHSYITGGNSQGEHFRQPNSQAQYVNADNTCETCNTYNMLRLTRELFKVTKDKKYADFYENTYTNAILSSQNPETGMFMYFQPMGSGYNKVFSPTNSDRFWCCVGTGMDSFSKLNDSLYFTEDDNTYVNMYYSSEFRNQTSNLKLTQQANMPNSDEVTINIDSIDGNAVNNANVYFRIPDWCDGQPTVIINGNSIASPVIEGGYIKVASVQKGDSIKLTFPMKVTYHELPSNGVAAYRNIVAFKYGPVVLSCGLGTNNITATTSEGVSVLKPVRDTTAPSTIAIENGTVNQWKTDINSNLVRIADSADGQVQFQLQGTDKDESLVYTPHYMRYADRYGLYMTLTGIQGEYPGIAQSIEVSATDITVGVERTKKITASVTFEDGANEEVTDVATYTSSNPEVCTVENGVITGVSIGEATITISYTGLLGGTVSASLNVSVIEPKDLQLWYKFNEESGTIAHDSSGYNRHATLVNNASFTGKAVYLNNTTTANDGSGAYVDLPKTILENVPDDFTISTWVNVESYNNSQWSRIFDFGPGSSSNIIFLTVRDLQVNMDNANSITAPNANRFSQASNRNKWVFVTVTREGNTTQIWVDGTSVATGVQTSTANRVNTSAGYYIGRANWADPQPQMSLRDFRIYNRALSEEEIINVMNYTESELSENAEVSISGKTVTYKITNDTDSDKTYVVIVGVYDDNNTLVETRSARIEVKADENIGERQLVIEGDITDKTVKAFVWDESQRPIIHSVTLK